MHSFEVTLEMWPHGPHTCMGNVADPALDLLYQYTTISVKRLTGALCCLTDA